MDPALIVLSLVLMIISLSFHEFAHAAVAKLLGDDTAQRQGRLTLNPAAHIDPIGTLLLPAVGAIAQVPMIGWAKPVPVDPWRFRRGIDRRLAYALVSIAGPLTNLLLAVLGFAAIAFAGPSLVLNEKISALLVQLVTLNVTLCVFNLLPIAPLDGSKLLPRSLDGLQQRIQPYSWFILMAIFLVPPLSHLLISRPVHFVLGLLARLFNL